MLLVSLALLITAIIAFTQLPSMSIYWSYPLPVYALLIGSVACAWLSSRRGVLRWVTVGVTGLLTVVFIAFTAVLWRLETHALNVAPGDPFPEFTLPTSTGGTFSPAELKGKKAALYIFYRGDW